MQSRNEIYLFTPVRPVRRVFVDNYCFNSDIVVRVCCLQKAYDRSWKPVWAVVRGQTLCLYKEKRESVPNISVDVSTHARLSMLCLFPRQNINRR